MTLEQWEEDKDRELDERLRGLFHSVPPIQPSAGFVSRTMKAVRMTSLPEGRQPLRGSWTLPAAWAALVALATVGAYALTTNQRVLAQIVSALTTFGVRAAMRVVQSVHVSSLVFDVLATSSRVISHALSTPQGATTVMVMGLVAAMSLAMLNKLLFPDKESSSW
jgi:hypothetical protein